MSDDFDYKCVNGHDLCHGGTSAGPSCPTCERVPAKPDDDALRCEGGWLVVAGATCPLCGATENEMCGEL